MFRDKRECTLKNHVYVTILIYQISNFIKEFNFLEILGDFRDISLSEKWVNVSCCIELISEISKIWAFY